MDTIADSSASQPAVPREVIQITHQASSNDLNANTSQLTSSDSQAYKRQCVSLSVLVAKKTVKINKLQNEVGAMKAQMHRESNADENGSLINDAERAELFGIGKEKRSDMTFVRKSLKFMYRNDIDCLRFKTIAGRKNRAFTLKNGEKITHEVREPLTPDKFDYLKALYAERVSDENQKKQFSKHMSNALNKIRKQLQKKPYFCNKSK